jgi:hypothetical protein
METRIDHVPSKISSFMKTTYSTVIYDKNKVNSSRYNLYYIILVSEPKKYPIDFPKSFAYWRQKIDLLSPYRFSSIIIDEITKRRKLKYIMDDASNIFYFAKLLKRNYPNIKIEYIRHQEYY